MADENELEPNPCQTPVEVESVEVIITDDNTVTNHEQRNCKTKKKDQGQSFLQIPLERH